MKKREINLQRFTEGSGGSAGGNGDGNQGGNAGYTYEQLEEIAGARAEKAERAAIAGYLREKGMSESDITVAINDFKEKQKENQPNVSAIEKERDDALGKVAKYENEKILTKKGVKEEDLDYVAFKVGQLVTDKKDFKAATDEYLKANPRFVGSSVGGYRMSSGTQAGSASGGTGAKNEEINNMIRSAFLR